MFNPKNKAYSTTLKTKIMGIKKVGSLNGYTHHPKYNSYDFYEVFMK